MSRHRADIARRKAESASTGRNIVLVALANFAPAVAAVLTAPLLARALGVEGRGELAAAVALYVLVVPIATAGVPEAGTFHTARQPAATPTVLRRTALLLALAGLAASGVAAAATLLISGPGPVRTLMLVAAAAVLPAVVISAPRGTSAGLGRWDLVNGERYLGAGAKLAAVAGCFAAGTLTLPAAVMIWVLTPALAGLAYLQLRRDQRLVRGRDDLAGAADGATLSRLLGYAGRTSVGSLTGMVLARADQVLMVPLAGATQLGLYAAAVNVSDAAAIANLAVRDVLFSAQSGAKDTARLTRAARASFAVSLTVGVALLAPVGWWFPLAFGEQFRAALPSVVVILVGGVFGVPGSVAGAALSAIGRPGLRSVSLAVAAAANVVLVLVLVPALGSLGAAAAAAIGSGVASNLNIMLVVRLEHVRVRDFYLVRLEDLRAVERVLRGLLARPGRPADHAV